MFQEPTAPEWVIAYFFLGCLLLVVLVFAAVAIGISICKLAKIVYEEIAFQIIRYRYRRDKTF